MGSGKRILGTSVTAASQTSSIAPAGAVGIDMTQFTGQAKAQWWMLNLVVHSLTDDVYIWGAKAAGTIDDPTDDVWGKHQDEFATFPLGHVGSLAPGSYQFLVDGLGLYTRCAITVGGATRKADLHLGTVGVGALDTVVRAKVAGIAGELITVALVGDAGAGVTISEVGNAVTIHYHTGVSTVANVETAITGTSTLIEIETTGTAATVLVTPTDDFAATSLIGGVSHVDFTLSDVHESGRGN